MHHTRILIKHYSIGYCSTIDCIYLLTDFFKHYTNVTLVSEHNVCLRLSKMIKLSNG